MEFARAPVLVLGAGINGCAIARELLLNGMPVWLVDTADLASGATSGSSRLIHGGLRYLEFGEFDLVKESLAERTRLLRLAPQFVHPLKLWIPAATRFGGLWGAAGRFFGWRWWPSPTPRHGRGISLIRAGLALYDAFARFDLPKHEVIAVGSAPFQVDRSRYRWICSYYDAQVTFPERLVLAIVEDARQLSAEKSLEFRVLNYHQATLDGDTATIRPVGSNEPGASLKPSAIVNATGAWVDQALARLHVPSRRLMGGTKGSHAFTFSDRLRQALAGQGIYAEARDGRPVFVTPLAGTTLIGTTDEPFNGSPEEAIATPRELQYLLETVNSILPEINLTASDIDFHYCAVRPLPHGDAKSPAAITRRHALVEHEGKPMPIVSVVGGKLTTMRALAELTVAWILKRFDRTPTANSRDRVFPGGEHYPSERRAVDQTVVQIANSLDWPIEAVAATWELCGTRCEAILAASSDRALLRDTSLPCAWVRWSIRHEFPRSLADLVERRLMLLYDHRLSRACLHHLAELLAEAGIIAAPAITDLVNEEVERLAARFGKHVT